MLPHGLLISLSGIDGTGKSTVARQIREFLLSNYRIPSLYIWCKFGDHPLSRYRLARFIGWHKAAESDLSHNGSKRHSTLFKLYGMALLAFHLAKIALAVRSPLRRGCVVICDRYIFDTMVDLQQDLNLPMSRIRRIFESSWIPQPALKFLLDLAEETAFTRKADSASVEYLKERRAMYLDIAHEYELTVVDASQPVETVTQIVMERIKADSFHERGIR